MTGEKNGKMKVDINEYAINQPPEVRAWLSLIDIMLAGNCRVASSIVSNSKRTDGKFAYTSKKTKKAVCIINIGTSGCNISLRGNHFIHPNGTGNILDELPEDMFNYVMKGSGCGLGYCLNFDYSVKEDSNCVHGAAEVFTYNGIKSFRCPHNGYKFKLNEKTNFEMLTRWIKFEIAL